MSLTPLDILHTQFKSAFRGYNTNQVDDFVGAVAQALEAALKEKADLARRVESLEEEIDEVRRMKATLADALAVAQRSADELRASAHRQAELIIAEAEQARVKLVADAHAEAEKVRAEITLLQAQRDRFEAEFRAVLASYAEWLDRRGRDELVRSEVA